MCLEEMTGHPVPRGAIFHQGSRRRSEIVFSESLRLRAEETVIAVRQMLKSWELPPAVNDRRCPLCSLKDSCLPSVVGDVWRARAATQNLFRPFEEYPLSG
jgi:CRISPR-associated exonuclease Cas4